MTLFRTFVDVLAYCSDLGVALAAAALVESLSSPSALASTRNLVVLGDLVRPRALVGHRAALVQPSCPLRYVGLVNLEERSGFRFDNEKWDPTVVVCSYLATAAPRGHAFPVATQKSVVTNAHVRKAALAGDSGVWVHTCVLTDRRVLFKVFVLTTFGGCGERFRSVRKKI